MTHAERTTLQRRIDGLLEHARLHRKAVARVHGSAATCYHVRQAEEAERLAREVEATMNDPACLRPVQFDRS